MRKRATVVLGLLFAAGPASAFYFPDWPGSGVRPPPSLIPPEVSVIGNPPSSPPSSQPPAVVFPPAEENPPSAAPEPTTLALAGIGLAAVWGGRRTKK